ncbi:MAG: S4 domain-containing protein, partial [Phycisphaerae bacterium]
MRPKKTTAGRVRLQKFLSEAGVASRRRAEELIAAGRVLVNDAIVDDLPAFVDPHNDRVVVDGAPVRIQPLEYFLLHKPRGVVCTNRDPAGRPRAIDLLPPTRGRLNVVGRLDADSTG